MTPTMKMNTLSPQKFRELENLIKPTSISVPFRLLKQENAVIFANFVIDEIFMRSTGGQGLAHAENLVLLR